MDTCFSFGEKIILRPLKNEDLEIWTAWFNSPKVTEFMNKGYFPNTFEMQEAYFHSLAKRKSDMQLAIALKKTGRLIGIIGIHKIDWTHKKGDVSVVIGDTTSWGKGLASEAVRLITEHAFIKMNLRKLTAGTWANNKGSARCFEKNGFVLEGTLRESFFYKGVYVDEHRFGILRSDWDMALK